MITAFPKIFAIGTNYIVDIFQDDVEITEKVDGSQFAFGRIGEKVFMRSKGAQLFAENPEKMFSEGIAYVESIKHTLPNNIVFYTEYLKNSKHNTLAYDRVPKNHLILFGVMHVSGRFEIDLEAWAKFLNIDAVPVVFSGKINNATELVSMLEKDSILGGQKIEGVVVKNYHRKFLLGGQPMPLMAGKLVSERFKEVHRERWGKEETGKSRIQTFFDSFRTEARWEKAVQHLEEKGELSSQPKDIGKLFKEVHSDIESEECEAVKAWLWNEFKTELKRNATAGLPEWYKKRLVERSAFDNPQQKESV